MENLVIFGKGILGVIAIIASLLLSGWITGLIFSVHILWGILIDLMFAAVLVVIFRIGLIIHDA